MTDSCLFFGGTKRTPSYNNVHKYDVVNDVWLEAGNLPRPVHSSAICTDGQYVYIVGGSHSSGNSSGSPTSDVVRYNIRTEISEVVAQLPVALLSSAAAIYNGRLWVTGGILNDVYTGSNFNTKVYAYEIATDMW